MNLYRQNTFFKTILLITGAFILAITLIYTNYLANKLKENEEKNIYIFKEALREMSNIQEAMFLAESGNDPGSSFDLNRDISLLDTIIRSFPLPIIFEDENGMLEGQNFNKESNTDQKFLRQKRQDFIKSGSEPITGSGYASKI